VEDPIGVGTGDLDVAVAVPVEQRTDGVGCSAMKPSSDVAAATITFPVG